MVVWTQAEIGDGRTLLRPAGLALEGRIFGKQHESSHNLAPARCVRQTTTATHHAVTVIESDSGQTLHTATC